MPLIIEKIGGVCDLPGVLCSLLRFIIYVSVKILGVGYCVLNTSIVLLDRDWSARERDGGFNAAEKFLLIRIKTDRREVSSLPG